MKRIVIARTVVVTVCLFVLAAFRLQAQPKPVALERLTQSEVVSGFRTDAIYLDDVDKPMGGRFVHLKTGFVFDLLQIQSVPQAYMWVNTPPTSDKGEPHTQEHLLLGKGNKGRAVANSQDMSLTESGAYTEQWRTCFFFNTVSGSSVFYNQLESRLDAMLHPNYTDEEIRREVRNFGISENPESKALKLEEKGSVYDEMVSTFDQPGARLWYALQHLLYGPHHPLAYESGGTPEALRIINPTDIRLFHNTHYRLNNMGMVGSFPKEMPVEQVLQRTNALLNRLQPIPSGPNPDGDVPKFPLPAPAPTGTIQIEDYPDRNEQKPGSLILAWPAIRSLDTRQQTLCELFLQNIAGDPATNLYKLFIDTKTRKMDLGATGIGAFLSDNPGFPIMVNLSDVSLSHLNDGNIRYIRRAVLDELARIASWKDGSPELAQFNARLAAYVVDTRRSVSKALNTPPGFGSRFSSSWWMDHFRELERTGGFRRSITQKPDLAYVEKLLTSKRNFWRDMLSEWRLTGTTPYAVAVRPSSALAAREGVEREARVDAEIALLRRQYGSTDNEAALQQYRKEYDAATAKIDALARQVPMPKFISSPPMTLDDLLDYKTITLPGGVPLVASTFNNMTSATTGLALRLDGVPENRLLYLTLLPELLTQVGVVENGKPVSYEQMQERMRREILSLNASFGVNNNTKRYELLLHGAGNTMSESQRAVGWMQKVLLAPDWRPENLSRIRDLVDQALNAERNVRQGSEETWVNGVASAYRRQDSPLALTISCFLTRAHNMQRLRWQFMLVPTAADRAAASIFLDHLADAGKSASRAELLALIETIQPHNASSGLTIIQVNREYEKMPDGAQKVVSEAAKDLTQAIPDIPDNSLATDWSYLCRQMRADLNVTPEKALENISSLRRMLLKLGDARLFVTGSSLSQQKLQQPIRELLSHLVPGKNLPAPNDNTLRILSRLREREPDDAKPVFIGLLNPNSQGGVFINSAPGITYSNTQSELLLQFLAGNLYAGGGAHSVFMQTWGAGLAYSNGIGTSPDSERLSYYAERCPELPQTLRFVIDVLKKAPRDMPLTEYVLAQSFYSRSAGDYETRGEQMANDLVDGITPDLVRRFRQAVLQLRSRPGLSEALYKRMDAQYARILPGYGGKMAEVAGGVYFVIGGEKQFTTYEAYLKSVEGADTRLYRLAPRDFWLPAHIIVGSK